MRRRIGWAVGVMFVVAGLAQGQQPGGPAPYPPYPAPAPNLAPPGYGYPPPNAPPQYAYPYPAASPSFESYPPPAYDPYAQPAYPAYPPMQNPAESAPPVAMPEQAAVPEEVVTPPPPAGSWFDSSYWTPTDDWDANLELGINGASGNAESFSLRSGGALKHKTDAHEFSMSLTYAKTEAGGVETQNNALFQSRSEWLFATSPWTIFGQYRLEYDAFKAWDFRWVVNGGLGYRLIKSDTITLTTRLGAGASREIGGPDDEYKPEALAAIEYSHQFTKRQSFTAKSEYLPSWTDFADYRMLSDVSWVLKLDDVDSLSLKLGVIDRYDSTPSGRKPNDIDYSVLLIWKL